MTARRAARAAALLAITYGAWCAALFILQDSIVYPRHVIGPAPPESSRPPGVDVWWIDTPAGTRVEAWFMLGRGRTPESPGPALIWLHGNAELIDHNLTPARLYARMGISVLLPEYRGYGRSEGTPSQAGITADLVRFRDRLAEMPEVDPDRLVYHGESLGSGFACALATERPPRAMVLNSPFTSVISMAARFLVPGFLVTSPLRSDRVLAMLDVPVLIFHGTGDDVVPIGHGRRLARVARRAEMVELDCGHNDLPPDWRTYMERVREHLERSGVLSGP